MNNQLDLPFPFVYCSSECIISKTVTRIEGRFDEIKMLFKQKRMIVSFPICEWDKNSITIYPMRTNEIHYKKYLNVGEGSGEKRSCSCKQEFIWLVCFKLIEYLQSEFHSRFTQKKGSHRAKNKWRKNRVFTGCIFHQYTIELNGIIRWNLLFIDQSNNSI